MAPKRDARASKDRRVEGGGEVEIAMEALQHCSGDRRTRRASGGFRGERVYPIHNIMEAFGALPFDTLQCVPGFQSRHTIAQGGASPIARKRSCEGAEDEVVCRQSKGGWYVLFIAERQESAQCLTITDQCWGRPTMLKGTRDVRVRPC